MLSQHSTTSGRLEHFLSRALEALRPAEHLVHRPKLQLAVSEHSSQFQNTASVIQDTSPQYRARIFNLGYGLEAEQCGDCLAWKAETLKLTTGGLQLCTPKK